jgi:hypothetical protein
VVACLGEGTGHTVAVWVALETELSVKLDNVIISTVPSQNFETMKLVIY